MDAEHIPHLVDMDLVESECAETSLKPFAAGCFPEWRSRDARHFELPRRKLRFLGANPSECGAGCRTRSQARDLLLDRGGD
jgi:hypothetical protein